MMVLTPEQVMFLGGGAAVTILSGIVIAKQGFSLGSLLSLLTGIGVVSLVVSGHMWCLLLYNRI